nr:hypothetical protein [Tanacetum cinerariifolium]
MFCLELTFGSLDIWLCRLLLLVVVGVVRIVGRIVVGKKMLGLVVVGKFGIVGRIVVGKKMLGLVVVGKFGKMETKDTLSSCSNSEEQQMQQIQDKAKESCMVSFRQLHSHLKLLSNNVLKGTRTKCGFKRAFATLFGQDVETFTCTMFLNMDQLEKQLDNEEFQEIGSMADFKVLETQFQMLIKSRIYLDDEYVVMTRNYFLQYSQLEILEFRDTLIQHMESVKKSIDKKALHTREYDSWVNEKQMQTAEEKVDTSKALDASLVNIESSGTESKEHDTNNKSGNDAHADDADIRPIYNEEPMDEVQTTTEINAFVIGQ